MKFELDFKLRRHYVDFKSGANMEQTFEYFTQVWIQIDGKWQKYTQISYKQIVFVKL